MSDSEKCRVQGTVAPGFESVQQLFEHSMNTLAEENAQLCVYYQGQQVVDLWASTNNDGNFSADSLVNVFSSGKSLESIALASLVSKGLLNYDAKIIDYWPEFGANGKGELTIAELMRHEAGLANFDVSMVLDDLLTQNIKNNAVGRIIEAQTQQYDTDNKREYHAVTRGWIANEVFRRVDPAGRTIGEFLKQDISGPLGTDAIIGVQKEELVRVSRVSPLGFLFQIFEGMKPKFLGRRIVPNFFRIVGRLLRVLPAIRRAKAAHTPAPYVGMDSIKIFNQAGLAMGESPSSNAHCSARGLAKIAAMMSAGGKWAGEEFLSEQAWAALHDKPMEAVIGELYSTRFTQGGVDQFVPCTARSTKTDRDLNEGREGFYGWMGLGGSIFQWHPQLDIGFGFVPTSLHALDILNERGKAYQAEMLKCIERELSTDEDYRPAIISQ